MSGVEKPLRVLVIDDEELLVSSCRRILEGEGYQVETALSGEAGLELLRRVQADIVLTDLALPGIDGMTVLKEAKTLDPDGAVIMITAFATVESSIEAIRAGAYDYLPKPFSAIQLQVIVGRAAQQVRLARDNERLRGELRRHYSLNNVVGRSASMERVAALVRRVAPTDASVFITGESGTGKELIAGAVHALSRRAEKPFVAVNCAALPDNLLESELFGHERGAFTGAHATKRGLVESAHRGTFFMDEICEMSQDLQAKLLRMLQERRVRRLGGEKEIAVDIRVMAATNRDVREAVRTGVLREDLYFRINVVPIRLPPLRERREDIPLLAEYFLRQYAERYEKDAGRRLRLAPEAMQALVSHQWPGNVRELQNLMERLVSLAYPGQEIQLEDLPPPWSEAGPPVRPGPGVFLASAAMPFHAAKSAAIDAFERRYLQLALAESAGNVSKAARQAGIDRRTIHRLLRKHGLSAAELDVSGEESEGGPGTD